jgi:hypothetical protein
MFRLRVPNGVNGAEIEIIAPTDSRLDFALALALALAPTPAQAESQKPHQQKRQGDGE